MDGDSALHLIEACAGQRIAQSRAMITITNFARGARGLRAIWLCEEMGVGYQVEHIPYPVPDTYLVKHPLGVVPFLEDDGIAISESAAILLYIARRYGPTPLLPADDDPRLAAVLQFVVFSEATFGAGVNTLMAAHFGAPEEDKRNWSVLGLEKKLEDALDYVALKLGEQTYLAGQFSLADIAVHTAMGVWKGALGKTIPPRLAMYREILTARPAYQRALVANGNTPS